MDSHHSIHTLAAIANGGGQQNSKQHPMHQFHHTLQHNSNNHHNNQPLVNANNQNHQLLHFHHPATPPTATNATTISHPYSTLHHNPPQHHPHNQLISQLQHLNNVGASNANFNNFHHQSSSQNSASSQATIPRQHHFNTNAMQIATSNHGGSNATSNNNSQQAYNMNSSDYSSSTYHVYDQILGDQIIDDLIVIKQERMKKKLEQEHRRKVILFSLAVILLVGLLMFLIVQLFRATSTSSQTATPGIGLTIQQQQQLARESNSILQQMPNDQHQSPYGSNARTPWTPSNGAQSKPNWQFDTAHFTPQPPPFRQPQEPLMYPDNQQPTIDKTRVPSNDQQPQDSIQQQVQLAKCLMTNCNNNGQCNPLGRCQCYPGFIGPQCEYSYPIAPALTPQKIDQQPTDTIKADNLCPPVLNNCNGNGQCTAQGRCKCFRGFTGFSCQQRDLCFEKNCLNLGYCQPETGLCQCRPGFRGPQCEQRDDEHRQRMLNCSNHGKFDYILKKCNCDHGFSGVDCSEEKCEPIFQNYNNNSEQHSNPMDCGLNGLFDCQAKKCVCRDGFSGEKCQTQQCSPQCLRNGQCLNGTCVCQNGFYGKHCTFNGCPNQCSGRGQCVRVSGGATGVQQQADSNQHQEWRCQCAFGSTGDDCSSLTERQCDDGIDNDRGKLILSTF